MIPTDIARVIVDDQVVFYRPDEAIAIGEAARDFVSGSDVTVADEMPRNGRRGGEGEPVISPLPSAFRLTGVGDPVAVVDEARSRGLRVQLNHVFLAHGACGCSDPCCGPNPYGAFPYKATPYKATPYKATPYKATAPTETNAVPADVADPANRPLGAPLQEGEEPDVNVWIIDTGKNDDSVSTPLEGRVKGDRVDRPNKPPLDGDELVDPVAGHGTFIAGIIKQIAPECVVDIRGVIGPAGDLSEWDVAATIDALVTDPDSVNLHRTILNLSFGGGLYSACNPVVEEAIAAAQEAGVVVVASAGNDGSCLPVYPANFAGVVSVGALDSDGEPAHFTNRGSWVTACALGVDIVSTFFDTPPDLKPQFKGWAIWSGTSFATPVVVAAIVNAMSGGASAVDARDSVLREGEVVPCLGVRVDREGLSDTLSA